MIVLERPLSKVYPEIDMVTTPAGKPVAMVHSNNCTSDLNAWIGLFKEFAEALGVRLDQAALFEMLYQKALAGDADGGGLLAYNYLSGEHITHFEEGVRCSSVLLRAVSRSRTSCGCICSQHWPR